MKSIKGILVVTMLVLASSNSFAQEKPAHEVYSMMVSNFIKYVQWSDFDKSGEFVIGVVGSNDIYNTLNTWYNGKAKGSKTYVIKRFNSAAEITNCHVIFIDKSKSNEFAAVNEKVKGKETLVITDHNGLGEKGSCINFKLVDSKLKFELNQHALEAKNLKVSNSLASIAILI